MCRRMPLKTAPITMTFWSRGNGSVPRLLRCFAALPLSPNYLLTDTLSYRLYILKGPS